MVDLVDQDRARDIVQKLVGLLVASVNAGLVLPVHPERCGPCIELGSD